MEVIGIIIHSDEIHVVEKLVKSELIGAAIFLFILSLFFVLLWYFWTRIKKERFSEKVKNMKFRMLHERLNGAMFEYDPKNDRFNYSYMNCHGKIINGSMEHYLHNKLYRNTVHPDFWEVYEASLHDAVKGIHIRSLEYKMRISYCEYKVPDSCILYEWRPSCETLDKDKEYELEEEYHQYRLTYENVSDEKNKVRLVIGHAENINELYTARLEAETDSVTGILNRRALSRRIKDRLLKNQSPFAILMIDIDNFKQLNDLHGHMSGDLALRRVGILLKTVFSPDDIIGRFGGDEFLIFMDNVSADIAEKRAQLLCSLFKTQISFCNMLMTCSIGLAYSDGEITELNKLIEIADEAMYKSKHSGKNTVTPVRASI